MFNSYSGQLPETVYLTFVEQEAYNGHQEKNPFNFEAVNLKEASLIVNNRHEPMVPLTNLTNSGKKREFWQHFLENTGYDHFQSQACNITEQDFFERGYFILAWDRLDSDTKN